MRKFKSVNGSQKHISVSNSQGEEQNISLDIFGFLRILAKIQGIFGFLEESILFKA